MPGLGLRCVFLGLMFGDSLPTLASCLREDGCCEEIYNVTDQNINAILPALNIGEAVKNEIIFSVRTGKEAMVSQAAVSVGNWTGVGYIITDPDTGAGAYRISGGDNGAVLELLTSVNSVLLTAGLGFCRRS